MNYNIPHFRCLIKEAYFTKNADDKGWFNAIAFAVQSLSGRMLTFHVATDCGMMRSRVPLSEIYFSKVQEFIPFHYLQLWDCFSENAHIVTYDFLGYKRCEVILKDKSKVWASYLFTIDWHSNPYSDEPQDYKCGHILQGDNGRLLCMPNNRILWKDSNWITKPIDPNLSRFKVDTELLTVENNSDRWIAENSNSFYYEIKND